MIKVNVITNNINWLRYIKNPNNYLDKILSNASKPSIINNNTYTTNNNDTNNAGNAIANTLHNIGGDIAGWFKHPFLAPTPPVAPHTIPTRIITPTHSTSTHVIKW